MKSISMVARALFPVDARSGAGRSRRSSSGRSSLLSQVLAIACAMTPLIVVIDAIAETA